MSAARLWEEIARRDETIASVKAKREEAVAVTRLDRRAAGRSPAAQDQAAALEHFYLHLRAAHALQRHTTGGFPLLVTQMMEAVSFGYAAHHLIWQPDARRPLALPSGRVRARADGDVRVRAAGILRGAHRASCVSWG